LGIFGYVWSQGWFTTFNNVKTGWHKQMNRILLEEIFEHAPGCNHTDVNCRNDNVKNSARRIAGLLD